MLRIQQDFFFLSVATNIIQHLVASDHPTCHTNSLVKLVHEHM